MKTTDAAWFAGWRMKFSIGAFALSLFTIIWFAIAAIGTKLGLWTWQTGLYGLTFAGGGVLAVLAVTMSLAAQGVALYKFPRKQIFIVALAATLISAMCFFRILGFASQLAAVPPIHDVQTDWDDPIRFSDAIMSERNAGDGSNPVVDAPVIADRAARRWPGLEGRLVSEIQEQAETSINGEPAIYPRLAPLYFDQAPNEIAAATLAIIAQRGWQLVTVPDVSEDTGLPLRIEAVAVSGWYGFKDDVGIRITPIEGATRIDIRSVSRAGLSDLGANSKRVYGLLSELQDRQDGRWEF